MNTTESKLNAAVDLSIAALYKAAQSAIGVAILIDPALADPLQPHIEELGLEPLRLRIATRQVDTDKLPYLVWIADASRAERLINTSIRIAVAERLSPDPDWPAGMRSVCAWFVSPALTSESDAKALARRLATQGIQTDADGGRHYFRFFDPRIAGHLPRILEPAQRQELGRITGNGWLGMDEHGELQALLLAGPDAPQSNTITPLTGLPEVPPLKLTPGQWQNFVVLGWRNRIGQALVDWDLKRTPTPDALMEIARRAVGHKLTSEMDALTFAYYALTTHPLFDRHPHIASALQEHATTAEPVFADRLNQKDEDFWHTVSAGAWLHAAP